jgi:hypothetical protein
MAKRKDRMNCEIEVHIAMWAPSENRLRFAGGPWIVPNMPISAGQMGPRAGGPTKPQSNAPELNITT